MKKVILYLIALSIFVSCATVELSEKNNIIDLPGMPKQQIYQKSMQWLTLRFVSGKSVIDYKDANMGRIIAKGTFFLAQFMNYAQYVNFIATIDSVNGRAKITINPSGCRSNLLDCPCNGNYVMPSALEKINPTIDDFMADYKSYMTGGKSPAWDGK